ncbi:hypothetical protein MMC11_003455 [Xylographa trunciseda]|nr:hypothetical protein [Xylographa trunciseda]
MPSRHPRTHFLCLPLVTTISKPQLLNSLQQFAVSVSGSGDERSFQVSGKAIRPLGTLHLTLGVMSLQSRERVDAAIVFLRSLDTHGLLKKAAESAIQNTDSRTTDSADGTHLTYAVTNAPQAERTTPPLIIALRGLYPMHSPSSTSILYTSPQDSSRRLQHFCLALQTAFTEAGFLVPETRPLLLHATIVNTIYAKERSERTAGGGHGKRGKGRGGFDATEVLEKFGETTWAEGIRLEKVAICEMGAKKVDGGEGSEEYFEVGCIELP